MERERHFVNGRENGGESYVFGIIPCGFTDDNVGSVVEIFVARAESFVVMGTRDELLVTGWRFVEWTAGNCFCDCYKDSFGRGYEWWCDRTRDSSSDSTRLTVSIICQGKRNRAVGWRWEIWKTGW